MNDFTDNEWEEMSAEDKIPSTLEFVMPLAFSDGSRAEMKIEYTGYFPDQMRDEMSFLASFFPIVVAAMNGVRNVPSMYRRAGRNFGLSPGKLLAKVVFPAALPQIIVGLRIALGIAWLVVVAAEMLAVDSGLGYLVIDARNSGNRYDLVIAAMVMIGVIGLALDLIFRRLEQIKSVRWGFRLEA